MRGRRGDGMATASRVAWELEHGPIPDGLFVCHRCDTPLCVNAAHLFVGTPAENTRDMHAKGRAPDQKGSRHGMAKLSEADAARVLNRLASGESCASIARAFGVSGTTVSMIKNRVHWRHVKGGA
jgi:FixJ family two-component response regulator